LTHAQEPFFINYSINDGLPSNNIYSIVNDKEGFLWFTSDVGIIKYDSKTFTLYNTDDGLSDNEVFQIKEDSKGRKWLLTFNGTPSYIFKGKIYNETNSELIKEVKGKSMLLDFYEDENNNIYLSYLKEELITAKNDGLVNKNYINDANVAGSWTNKNNIYSLTSRGIYNATKNTFHESFKFRSSFRLYHQGDQVYYSNGSILYQINSDNKSQKLFKLNFNTQIINVYKESDSKIWICTRNGLFLFEENIQQKHFFKTNVISSITKDIEGNYWISTLDKGLLFVPSFEVSQKQININCIAKNNNDIWFGGFENDFYIKKNNEFEKRELNPSWPKNSISNIRFFNNTSYVTGKSGLLKLSNSRLEEFQLNINDILAVNDQLFIASTNTFKIKSNLLNNDLFFKNKSKVILNKRTNTFTQGDKDNIWIGTNIGLFKYNLKDSIQTINDNDKILDTSIKDIYFDNESLMLLVATASKGVIILKNNETIHTISLKDGLNNNTTNTIEKLDSNSYLIGTNNGLNLIKLEKDKFFTKNYNTAFGFKNKKINDIAYVNDTIYVASNNAIIYFNSNYLNTKTSNPICLIDGLYTKNSSIDSKNKISYKDNEISIRYTGISFIDRGNITYHYNLNGEWSTTKETQLKYNTLAPNDYTFSVYGVNGFGKKSNIETINFTVLKPFWKQWWFLMFIATLLTLAILSLWKIRVSYLNREFEKERKAMTLENENIILENQMLALEQKALRLQMNPHFMFNALNSIKGYYSVGDAANANNYIEKFSKLLRMLLEIEDQVTTLENEIEMLTLYLELNKIRYKDKFDYTISVAKNINTNSIAIPSLLLQPLAENAIIHGLAPKQEKGLLEVSFSNIANTLICIVKDNGIGRYASSKIKKEKGYQSKALTITKERLNLFDDEASIHFEDLHKNSKATGTKVTIKTTLKSIW